MPKPQLSTKKEKEIYQLPVYTKEELKKFESELENYKITKNIKGKDYTFYDEDSYLIDNSALSRNGAIIVTGYDIKYDRNNESYPICDNPTKYEILKDKFDKLYKQQSRKEYAIKNIGKELSVTYKID